MSPVRWTLSPSIFPFFARARGALTPPFELFVNAILSPHEDNEISRGGVGGRHSHSVIRILRPSRRNKKGLGLLPLEVEET